MSQPYPEEGYSPKRKLSAKDFLASPLFIIMIFVLGVGIWFGSYFINTASNPTPENSLNYYGVAEVLDIGETPSKCFVDIKREAEGGKETRQHMTKSDCRKFRVGERINLANGQYVSTVPNNYLGR